MKNEKVGIIYCYTSPSGEHYVGQTINERSRKNKHKQETSKTYTKFGKALREYGWDNFTYKVLFQVKVQGGVKMKRILDIMEIHFVKHLDSMNNGYNSTRGGKGTKGLKHTEEMKLYIGQCTKERMTEEVKQAMSEKTKGRVCPVVYTDEIRQNLSNGRKNKKLVYKYDKEGELVATFISIADAAKSLLNDASPKTKANRISECCAGKWQSYQEFKWTFTEEVLSH